jgi:hypothetical protein
MNAQETRAYYQGLREGLKRYAWWRDGVQYVGSCGRTLKHALAEVDLEERDEVAAANLRGVEGLSLERNVG